MYIITHLNVISALSFTVAMSSHVDSMLLAELRGEETIPGFQIGIPG